MLHFTTLIASAALVASTFASPTPAKVAAAIPKPVHNRSPANSKAHVETRDVTSAWSFYIGGAEKVTGACGVPYNDWSHGACVSPDQMNKCGSKIYAYLGSGTDGGPSTEVTVVDVCTSLGEDGLYLTLDAFEELGGTEQAGVLYNVNWKYL